MSKTFTYTHHQGGEGKMVEKATMDEPVASSSLDYKKMYDQHCQYLVTYPTLGFSPSDNGKTFNEGEFEVKLQKRASTTSE